MMRFTLLTLAAFFLILPASAQTSGWQWVNPLPQGNLLNAICSVNTDTMIAVGDVGTILRTTDAGVTWQVGQNTAGTTDQLFGVQFINATTGWAVGEFGRLLKTTDGGNTWFAQDVQTTYDLYSVAFVSPTVGWIAGSQGIAFMTTNGGDTWTQQTTNTTETFFSVYFRTTTNGWLVGTSGKILTTTNAGATWTTQTSGTTQTLYSIQFTSPSIGYISGSFGTLLKTLNGGASWIPLTSGIEISLYGLHFTSSLTGWAVGSFGTVIKTTNGGTSWFSQTVPTSNDLFGLIFNGSGFGYAVGDYGTIVKTLDGSNWLPVSNGPKNTIYGMYFSAPSRGVAVGDLGTIMQTTDAGRSWTTLNSGTFKPLYGAYFTSATTGWVVGDSATILKTTNSGANWVEENTHTDPSLYSISFASPSVGWAVGDFGTILATTNGGLSWSGQNSTVPNTLLRVRFATTSIGWAIGYGGLILKTTNGGGTWTRQTSGTTLALDGIAVIDQFTAYISGDAGLMLATTNGGTTWTSQNTNTDASLYGVTFFSPTLGWAAGDYGTVVTTNDGGTTWNVINPITDFSFFEIQAVHATSGGIVYASGEGGTILASTVSPLPLRTWTGAFDSSWFNGANWSPTGVPEKLDSIYIPATAISPSIRTSEQQINLGALTIAPNAKLTISPNVATVVVKSNITVFGTFTLEPGAITQIYAGGSFSTQIAGVFNPGNSALIFTGTGSVKGSFYDLTIGPSAAMQSIGNIGIAHSMSVLTNFFLRSSDTLTISNSEQGSFDGPGIVSPGTIVRSIKAGATFPYRFESELTYLDFYATGTNPSAIAMSVYPNLLPAGLPDSIFVRRYYAIKASGGSGYMATLSLRYDTGETPITIDNLALFRDSSGFVFNMGNTDFVDSDLVSISLDSVTAFSQWYLGRWDYQPHHPYQFYDSLIVRDNGGATDTLAFGAQPGATDGIDSSFGEAALGPKPGAGTFDTRWSIPATNGSMSDIRDILPPGSLPRTYTFSLQPGPGGYPMTIRWDSTHLAAGTFFIRDQASHGGAFQKSMKQQQTLSIASSAISAIEIVHQLPTYFSFVSGWNLVSLPLVPTNDGRRVTTFPDVASEAFGFAGSYFIADTLHRAQGYWIKFAAPQIVGFEGTTKSLDTIVVTDGWNLIGAGSGATYKGSITHSPGTSVTSNYFQYGNGYILADTLKSSKGYWVKVAGNGFLYVTSSSVEKTSEAVSSADAVAKLNVLTVADKSGGRQLLYFGHPSTPAATEEAFAMPPSPPDGAFDARFTAHGSLAGIDAADRFQRTLRVTSTSQSVTVQWHLQQDGIRSVRFTDAQGRVLASGGTRATDGAFTLHPGGAMTITLDVVYDGTLPTAFRLDQNYPNPFNPSTRISFALPVDAQVSLKVFNVLGQVVAGVITNQAFAAGEHTVTLDGGAMSSGVYFYQLQARGVNGKEFSTARKMLLIR